MSVVANPGMASSNHPVSVTLCEFETQYPEIDRAILMDLAYAVDKGGVSREVALEMLEEMRVEDVIQKETEKCLQVECTVYVSNLHGNRKVADDCRRLKLIFDILKVRYNEVDFSENRWLRRKVVQDAGVDTLPLVFVGQKFVGTYDDIEQWNDEGKLFEKLRAAGYR